MGTVLVPIATPIHFRIMGFNTHYRFSPSRERFAMPDLIMAREQQNTVLFNIGNRVFTHNGQLSGPTPAITE